MKQEINCEAMKFIKSGGIGNEKKNGIADVGAFIVEYACRLRSREQSDRLRFRERIAKGKSGSEFGSCIIG